MAQQALRRHHHQRQRIGLQQQRLPPQQVEILRRRGAVGDAHVGVGRRIEEPLETRARMIRALAFVAVRQEQHQRRRHAPLRAARGQVFVEDDLRAVDEVAVLRFPQHQAIGLLQVVAELEADAGVFRQRAVANLERRLRLRQRLQRDVLFAGHRVVIHGVAMAEGAALDVFTGEANRHAVGEDRRHAPVLRRRPSRSFARSPTRTSPCAARGRARACDERVKPSGTVSSAVLIACSVSSGTAVRAFLAAPLGGTSGTGGT